MVRRSCAHLALAAHPEGRSRLICGPLNWVESGFISIDIAIGKMLKITRMFGDRAASISSAAGGRGFMHEGVSCFIFSRLDPSVIPKSRKELSMQ